MSLEVERTPAAVDGTAFRNAMSLLPAPLAIVTTQDETGRRWGFTASSVTSVSLDPPRVLVGIAHGSSCFPAFATAPEFVINILGTHHPETARRFATHGMDRFAGQPFTNWPGAGLPHLTDAPAALRCTAVRRIPVGDHDLLIGAPTEIRTNGPTTALVWYRRDFHRPVHTPP